MSAKNKKNGIIITVLMALVIIALLNVCTFVIPFNKINRAVRFTVYGFAEFVIFAEMVIVLCQILSDDDLNQKVFSLPIVYYGYVTIVLQILFAIFIYLTSSIVNFKLWFVIVIECFIIAFGAVQILKGLFFKQRNVDYHENVANTKFMDEFRARLKALNNINKNQNIERELADLLDVALGSDPITNDKTVDSEGELLSLLQELDEAVKIGSEDEARETIEKTRNALLERNVLCKAGK